MAWKAFSMSEPLIINFRKPHHSTSLPLVMTLFKVYMHALPILCGLGLAYTLQSHLHITDTHFTDNVQQGRVFIHTCSPACVQHAYNDIRLHNTIIMVNTPHHSHTLNLHSAPTGTPNFQNYVSHGLHFKSTKAASFL